MINQIFNEDCRETIRRMPDGLLDLVVTSPPYNIDLGNNKFKKKGYDIYDDSIGYDEYLHFLSSIFGELKSKLKIGGRIVINIGDSKNGSVPVSSDIIELMHKRLGYLPYTHIIWDKSQVANRQAWGSFKSPSSPSFPTPFEHILVFCKETKKLQYKGTTDLTKEEFINWSLALWKFTPETKQYEIGHPAMFPLELPIRCIKMFSWVGATVYDPFGGACTTAVAAQKLHRNWIVSEISDNYCKMGEKRLAQKELF